MNEGQTYDPVSLRILWNRLIAIVDEAAATLRRTSFSTLVRESNDFACVLLDREGRSLVQNSAAIPSFIGTLPITVRHLLHQFPPEVLKPGDILTTNDPWLATGHLPDLTLAMPIYRDGEIVARERQRGAPAGHWRANPKRRRANHLRGRFADSASEVVRGR